jgi:hypothetical protein
MTEDAGGMNERPNVPAAQPRVSIGHENLPAVPPPDRRILRVFAFDPMLSRLSGRFLSINIRFERGLRPGPVGELVQVLDYDVANRTWYQAVDLDDPFVLAQNGLRPSESDPRSHQQVVYAVALSVIERFERFTGRRFRWRGDDRLRIVPHAFEGRNAYFDPSRRAVLFGYYRAGEQDSEANLPGQLMFTCLSVDIVAHEVTHAIAHRVRRHFALASNPDVHAFHEAFADLVALFHHFAFTEVIDEAVAQSHSKLEDDAVLLNLAAEFGVSTGRGGPLRSAVKSEPVPGAFLTATEPHERGAIFVAAVFDAFLATFRAEIADLRRIATGGTGILSNGALSPDLVRRISAEAVRNADRILGMVVRAFDYLPVVDVTFGDVVRAIITADRGLFPDDTRLLRSHLVEALRRRGIYPPGVISLADEALVWRGPVVPLSFADPANPVDLSDLILNSTLKLDPEGRMPDPDNEATKRRAERINAQVTQWAQAHADELGFDPEAGRIQVAGIHVAYPLAADGQPRPRIFAQLVQRRGDLEVGPEHTRTPILAGTTVIARVDGEVEYLVGKPLPLLNPQRLEDPDSDPVIRLFALAQHEAGIARRNALDAWFATVEDADPLAVWLDKPAVSRLSFANIHAQARSPR